MEFEFAAGDFSVYYSVILIGSALAKFFVSEATLGDSGNQTLFPLWPAKQRSIEGAPIPRVGHNLPAHILAIDIFCAVGLGPRSREMTLEEKAPAPVEVRNTLARQLRQSGLVVHKETEGLGGILVGIDV